MFSTLDVRTRGALGALAILAGLVEIADRANGKELREARHFAEAARTGETTSPRLREGASLIDQAGTFRIVGDRTVFACEGEGRQLVVLENLALERVARAVRQSSSLQTWIISGTVTEYQGNNYLFLDRAVIRRP